MDLLERHGAELGSFGILKTYSVTLEDSLAQSAHLSTDAKLGNFYFMISDVRWSYFYMISCRISPSEERSWGLSC